MASDGDQDEEDYRLLRRTDRRARITMRAAPRTSCEREQMFASNCMNYLENGGRTLSRLIFS
jgi:hypothetical protein